MSVFTFDPNPPRVSSPWLRPQQGEDGDTGSDVSSTAPKSTTTTTTTTTTDTDSGGGGGAVTAYSLLSEYGLTRLPPEPQEGPIEYKLHLLLRPRRANHHAVSHVGTTSTVDGRFLQRTRVVASSTVGQTRQDRCQHLTTQLLWRLRQSSPYHASVSQQSVVVPVLPDDDVLLQNNGTERQTLQLGKLAPGLEESQGALYEIGVADDGALVGILQEELDQSIATLKWMAANLGCVSEVLRKVVVGGEDEADKRLWVAEVFIKPQLDVSISESGGTTTAQLGTVPTQDQLRVTLTGPTGSGKSTLLGTLSTGALDDGHGKTRLNSLRHRHELASGLTSTVTQELLGYGSDKDKKANIVNYANPNIESWTGIHDYAKDGRLVFVSDSAGHPRFRRTTMRGLIGWAPHWTLLCLSGEDGVVEGGGTTTTATTGLAKAHLDLCLKLDLPLAILITKADLLNKESLKRTLLPIWTAVKHAARTPQLLQSKTAVSGPIGENTIPAADLQAIERTLAPILSSGHLRAVVPVILTSSVTGDGIGLVHALLRSLPRPPKPTAHDFVGMALDPEQPEALFHIEDRFSRPVSYTTTTTATTTTSTTTSAVDPGHVLSGHLRFGRLCVGDEVVLGPFPSHDGTPAGGPDEEDPSTLPSHPSGCAAAATAVHHAVSASALQGEWHHGRIVSIRNLRMPVQALEADQVGTIGLVMTDRESRTTTKSVETPFAPKPRRGMVLAIPSQHMVRRDSPLQLQAASGLTAYFADDHIVTALSVGTPVTFYVASIRAQAKVVQIERPEVSGQHAGGGGEDVFGLDESVDEALPSSGYNVRLELLFGREWVEMGSQIVILEGASKEQFLLDGFIGKIVEIVDGPFIE